MFKTFKDLKKYHIYYIYKMTEEFYFFCNDCNNWNYNPFINTPNADPYKFKRVINISSNNSYNLIKYNCVIMLKEILKHTSKYLNDDVKEWILKKALQCSKNDYWEILSISTNLFYYYLFRTDETINYQKFRLWFRQNPIYRERESERERERERERESERQRERESEREREKPC